MVAERVLATDADGVCAVDRTCGQSLDEPLAVCRMADLLLIKKFPNTVQAEIAKTFLEQEGIHAAVLAADAAGTVSGFAGWLVGEGALYVLDTDVNNALALLESARLAELAAESEVPD